MEEVINKNKIDLSYLGLNIKGKIYRNLSIEKLIQEGLLNKETKMSMNGAVMVDTGIYTGRSPKDKYIVEEDSTKQNIWWGDVNQKLDEEILKYIEPGIVVTATRIEPSLHPPGPEKIIQNFLSSLILQLFAA